MEKIEAKQKIEELRTVLEELNYQYYVLDSPTVEDFEYDRMLHELMDLEEQFPEYALEHFCVKFFHIPSNLLDFETFLLDLF